MVAAEVITSDRLKGIESRCPECGRVMLSTGRMHYNAGVSTWFVEFECPVDDEFGITGPDLDKVTQAVLQEQPLFAEAAQTIIERYFLAPGERVARVTLGPGAALVETSEEQWMVTSAENPYYTLYDVRVYITAPQRPEGVAVLPDGTLLLLTEEAGLKEFWGKLGDRIEPDELAGLLTAYQGRGPTFERPQNLMKSRADLAGLLPDETLDAISGLTPLRPIRESDGRLTLDFCTYYLAQEPPDYVYKVGINRWRAEAAPPRGLQWSARPLGGLRDSPRYSGQDDSQREKRP